MLFQPRNRDDSELTYPRASAIYHLLTAYCDLHLMECEQCAKDRRHCPELDWFVQTRIKWYNRIALLRRSAKT